MSNIDQNEAKRLLDATFGVSAYVAPTTVAGAGQMKLHLTTTIPTDSSSGTEVSGGSYAAQTITMAAATVGFPTSTSNTGTVSFTGMPAVGSPGVQGANITDNAGTPRRCWFGSLSAARITAAGDTLSFAAGAVAVTLG